MGKLGASEPPPPRTMPTYTTTSLTYSQDAVLPESDLSSPDRKIWIITTASLPWMTGTAVNPLLRAAYLSRGRPAGKVTLVVPWLDEDDQKVVYPHGKTFRRPEDQERYIREWLGHRAGLGAEAKNLRIQFYSGRYHPELGSVFSVGDVPALIPDEDADVLILEEPEHLNWYRAPGVPWTRKFRHVVGICHTNYLVYSKSIQGGSMKSAFLFFMNQWMCRAYCHKVIKLSGALQRFAPGKEEVENVHGVRREFLEAGASVRGSEMEGAYFIGKMLWPKGMDRLIPMMVYARERDGRSFKMDVYGSGPDEEEIKRKVTARSLDITFHGAVDHAQLTHYKVFINPSISEVLCTTVAEALAMGKFVIIAAHPSNEFFMRFTNCLTFRSKEEFATQVLWALAHVPAPLSAEERESLTWEAATRRLLKASLVTVGTDSHSKVDKALEKAHTWVSKGERGDRLRRIAGGDIIADEAPPGPRHYANPPTAYECMAEAGARDAEGRLARAAEAAVAAAGMHSKVPWRGAHAGQGLGLGRKASVPAECCGDRDCQALAGAGFGGAGKPSTGAPPASSSPPFTGAVTGSRGAVGGKS